MAIIKSIEINDSGVFVGYWRIARVIVEFNVNQSGATDKVEVLVHGYTTKQARDDGKNYVVARTFEYSGSQVGENAENLSRASLYQAIKSNPDFTGAEDV